MQNELDSAINIGNDENHVDVENQPHVFALGRNRKLAVLALVFFTAVLVFVSISNMTKSINQPIGNYQEDEVAKPTQTTNSLDYATVDSDESLQAKDTDNDGLSDWEELNVYKTSPYLEDSDSDGFLDGAEVTSGNNPSCPHGKDCGNFVDTSEGDLSDTSNFSTVQDTTAQAALTTNSSSLETSDADLQVILSGESDATTLRSALLGYGVDKNMLDQISDEDLLKGYQESLQN